MKKLLVGLLAALLMCGGLVATTSGTATAAPYPGTVKTKTIPVGLGPLKGKAKVYVEIQSASGNPKGKLKFTFVNRKTGKTKNFTESTNGKPKTYTFKMKKGKYLVIATYVPKSGSKWKPSSGKTKLKVN